MFADYAFLARMNMAQRNAAENKQQNQRDGRIKQRGVEPLG